jgi:hypothetical protein
LLQLLDRLLLVLVDCPRTLIVDSGAAAFSHNLLQRSGQILGTPDFINQPKPFTSFDPRFQGCQHAFGAVEIVANVANMTDGFRPFRKANT